MGKKKKKEKRKGKEEEGEMAQRGRVPAKKKKGRDPKSLHFSNPVSDQGKEEKREIGKDNLPIPHKEKFSPLISTFWRKEKKSSAFSDHLQSPFVLAEGKKGGGKKKEKKPKLNLRANLFTTFSLNRPEAIRIKGKKGGKKKKKTRGKRQERKVSGRGVGPTIYPRPKKKERKKGGKRDRPHVKPYSLSRIGLTFKLS